MVYWLMVFILTLWHLFALLKEYYNPYRQLCNVSKNWENFPSIQFSHRYKLEISLIALLCNDLFENLLKY